MRRAVFVGRDRELRLLTEWLAEARAGDTRLALCCGEPGVGKTRLAEELVRHARASAVPAVWGRVLDVEGAPPFWLWRQVLRGTAEMADSARVAAELGVASDLAMLTDDFAGVPGPSLGDGRGLEQRFRMFDAVARFLGAVATQHGLVVVLDDIQWADRPSLLLLRHVLHGATGSRLFVLATYRHTKPASNTELAALISLPATNQLELAGLPYHDAHRQLAAIAGGDVPTDLARRIYDLSGGNPFFVRELARDLGRAGIPASLQASISQRTAGLSSESRELLGAASILGRECSVALLVAVVGRPVATCVDPLREAEVAGLIETTGPDHDGLRFVHALTRDVVEVGLQSDTRVPLHRAAAAAMEELYAGSIESHLSDLARHWAAAAVEGDSAMGSDWVERAGDEAVRRLAFEEAVRLYDLALTTYAGNIDDSQRYRLLLSLAKALRHCGRAERARAASVCAAAVAYALGVLVGIHLLDTDAIRALRDRLSAYLGKHVVAGTEVTNYLGPVELYVGKASRFLGSLDDAIEALDAAAAIAQTVGAAGFHVEAQYELAAALSSRRNPGDLPRARLIIANSLAAAHGLRMAPFQAALNQLAANLDARDAGGSLLTPREGEVAALIARGLTNRQIAAQLHISERTAQNHVQNILTKLGFTSRSQIAVWATRRSEYPE